MLHGGVLVIPQAASATLTRWSKVYSSSATVISGSDDSANILSYTPNVEQLYINGILVDYTNYVATSGSTIILNEGVVVDDVVDIISLDPINVINNGYTQEQVDAKLSNYTRWVKTLSGSATLINGNDDNSLPLNYTLGNEEVYVNGILLKRGTDYDTTSVNAITLTEAALSGDTIEIITFSTINLASVYTQTQSDIKYLTPATASTTYLTQSSASSTYLTPSSASNVYLTQSSASSTYLTQSSASALYDNIEQFMTLAISDESTSITTGINKLTMRSPYAMTLTRIPRASLNTVSSSGNPTVDINLSGTSILGVNKLSIDASEKTSTTAATATTLATTSIPDDSEITFDIDTAGTGAKGLKVILYYKRS